MHRLLRHIVLFWCCCVLGCQTTPDTGYVRIARPKVYDSETTKRALAAAGSAVAQKIRADAQIGTHVQEAASISGLNAAALRVGGQQVAPGAAEVTPAVPTAGSFTTPAVPRPVGPQEFGRTIDEQIEDLLHVENRAFAVELLYAGKGDASLGPNSRLYLVRFDIGLLPSRQSIWTYPFWVLQSGFGSTYRFTQGWFSEVRFEIPIHGSADEPPVYVQDIDPRYGVVTSIDSLANVNQFQIAAAYAMPGVAAQLDYMRRLEEQFAQQRRYPLQMGTLDGPYNFSWIFGPRRQVHKRGPARFIPFVSTYQVASRLEPGTRSGHALLVVPDVRRLAQLAMDAKSLHANGSTTLASPQSAESLANGFVPSVLKDPAGGRDRVEADYQSALGAGCPPAQSDRAVRICMIARGSYLELERPDSFVPVPLSPMLAEQESEGVDRLPKTVVRIPIDLPLDPPATPSRANLDVRMQSTGSNELVVELDLEDGDLANKGAAFKIVDAEGAEVKVTSADLLERTHARITAELPRRPNACQGTDCETILTVSVESNGRLSKNEYPYTGPGWRIRDERAHLSCPSGSEGAPNALMLGRDLPSAEDLEFVQFGKVRISPASPGWKVRNRGSVLFDVPAQPALSDRSAALATQEVGVIVYFKAKAKHDPAVVAPNFTYDVTRACGVSLAAAD